MATVNNTTSVPVADSATDSAPIADPVIADKKRQQLTDILGISISPARCAAHLKKNLYNKEIDEVIHALRTKLKDCSEEDAKTVKKDISLYSQKIIRISSETSTVMAVICDGFVEDLLKHSISETLASNKKMVDVNYIMSGDHKKNLYYSIYYKLPSFVNYDPSNYEELKKKRTEENKKNKKNKKVADETVSDEPVVEPVVETVTEPVVDPVTVESVDDGKTTFNTYIDAVLKNVKKQLQLSDNVKIRTSIEVRDFLSDMIVECIKRFVTLSKIFIQQIVGVRTMNADHIKAIVHMFMKDEGSTDEQINTVLGKINDKIDLFHRHIVNEKENKFNELDDRVKQDILDKKTEKNFNKKQKDLQQAEKRAQDITEKIKKLKEDIAVN
jgi:hypothetical protein